MNKREFIEQFVLNRAHADRQTDAPFWVRQADAAWELLNQIAPYVPDYTKADNINNT